MIEMICIGIFYPSFSETNIKHLGQDSHLSWDDPYYDIARHQIVEVAGEFSPYLQIVLYWNITHLLLQRISLVQIWCKWWVIIFKTH